MTDWPPAPRLQRALDNVDAQEPSLDDAWLAIQERIGDETSAPAARIDLGEPPAERNGRRWPKAVLAAAAALLIIAIGVVLQRDDDNTDGVTVETEENPADTTTTTVATTTTQPPPPAVTPPALALTDVESECTATPWDRYSDESGEAVLWAGGQVGAAGRTTAGRVILTDEEPDELVARAGVPAPNPEVFEFGFNLVAGPTAAPTIEVVLSDWFARTCGPLWAMLVIGGDVPPSFAAAMCDMQRPGDSWRGLALVGTDLLPPDCGRVQRAMLVDNRVATDPSVQAWVEAHECGDSIDRTDDDGNIITEWDDCTVTLIHVQTPGEDSWTATIEGERTIEYLDRLHDLAN